MSMREVSSMDWIYWLIIGFGIFSITWGIVSVIRAKNKVLDIKESINMILNPIAQLMWIHILTIFVVLEVGIQLLKGHSSDVFLLNFANGFEVGILILLFEFIGLWVYDEYNSHKNKTKTVLQKWIEYIEVNGVIRYTEEEKATRTIAHEKFVAKMYKYFPIFKKPDKKKVV